MDNNNNSTISWRDLLKNDYKTVFSGFVYMRDVSQGNIFDYVNDTKNNEKADAVLLDMAGNPVPDSSIKSFSVAPGGYFRVNVGEWLNSLSINEFYGSLLMVQRVDAEHDNLQKLSKNVIRAPMSNWHSSSSHAQIGYGASPYLNVPVKKDKQSFFMFCPSVVSTDKLKTLIVMFNFSSDHAYNDTVSLTPRLNSADGQYVVGRDINIPPFGTFILDVEKHFPKMTRNKIHTLTVSHTGHLMSSLFFHISRANGDIITGRHTQPAASVFRPMNINMPVNLARKYIPFSNLAINIAKKILRRGSNNLPSSYFLD